MQSPGRLAKRAASVWTPEDELLQLSGQVGFRSACMRRSLGWFDLLGLGVGGMVGAGVFVTAGVAAHSRAGPAVILSFLVAGFAALLSAFCYAEFAVDLPTAGGAFGYLGISLGEFAAFITGANLLLEYVISNAAVARTLTAYMALAVGCSPENWLVEVPGFWEGSYSLDFLAPTIIFLITMSICYRSVLLVTVLYSAMAGALCMLRPYDQIDIKAPFSSALEEVAVGWRWVEKVVQLGACLGILTSLLVAMLGQARYLCAIARSHLIPFWLAKVDSTSSTPLRSSAVLGVVTGTIALVVDTSVLLDLISIGTLFVFYMVSNALVFRRHVLAGVTNPFPTALFLATATALSLSFVAFWRIGSCQPCRTIGLSCSLCALLAATSAFWALVPCVERPVKPSWQARCMPWLAVLSIFVNVFLAGSLGAQAYCRFAAWSVVAVVFYVGYGVHAAHDAHAEVAGAAIQCVGVDDYPAPFTVT